jgi:hypothetical protein
MTELPPFSNLQLIGRNRDGSAIYGPKYAARAEAQERPRSVYRGEASPTLCYGELTRRGQDFFSNDWPTDERCEPMNDAAREVVAYFARHRSSPRLPRTAWDEIRGRLNTIEESAPQASVELRPRLRTRGERANGQ